MKECTPLSASRIKTAQGCSWSYWSNYHLKIPDSGNDGANRGWICHLVFELLGNPRHRKIYDEIILRDSIFLSPPMSRLVGYHARRLGVNDKENLELINRMTLAGLHFDFFGANRVAPDKAISEQDFNITVSEGEKLYRVRGYIDKLFLYEKDSIAVIRDFKSSKAVFKGKDITDNLQDLIYTLAVKKLFPHFKSRQVEFLFLKFDLNSTGCIKMKELSPEELEGLELQLTQIQKYLKDHPHDAKNWVANSLLSKFAFKHPVFLKQMKAEFMREFDPDGSGELDKGELLNFIAFHVKMGFKNGMSPVTEFDDKNGTLDIPTIKMLLKQRCPDLIKKYENLDTDGGGTYSWNELLPISQDFYFSMYRYANMKGICTI